MTKSGVLQNHKNRDKVFELKLEHIKSQINVSQRIFYSILAFFGAILVFLLDVIKNLKNFWGQIILSITFIIVSSILIKGTAEMLQDKIKSYYNELFMNYLLVI